MTRILQTKTKRRGQRGSALILTMAVLALLLTIAIFFAFDVQLSKRLSDNYRHALQAKLLNECGLNRAIALIDDFDQFKDYAVPRQRQMFLYPAQETFTQGTAPWNGLRVFALLDNSPVQDGLDSALQVRFRTNVLTQPWEFTPDDLSTTQFDSATWDPVIVKNRVIGQFTYLIIDETGKLDPGYLGTNLTESLQKTRLRHVNINDISADLSNALVVDSCFSYAHLALAGAPDEDSTVMIRQTLFPGSLPVREEFWFDANHDSVCTDSEIFARMDYTRIDSSMASQLYAFLLTGDSTTAITATTGLDSSLWLHGVGIANNSNARRYAAQLTANMIDYTDSDSLPTLVYLRDGYDLVVDPGDYPPTSSDSEVVYGVESGMSLVALNLDLWVEEFVGAKGTANMLMGRLKFQLLNPFGDSIDSVAVNAGLQIEGGNGSTTEKYPDLAPGLPVSMTQIVNGHYVELTSDSFAVNIKNALSLASDSTFTIDTVTLKHIEIYSNSGAGEELTMAYPRYISEKLLSDVAAWRPNNDKLSPKTDSTWHGYIEAKTGANVDLMMIPVSPLEDIGTLITGSASGTIWDQSQVTNTDSGDGAPVSGLTQATIEGEFLYRNAPYGQSAVKNSALASLGDLGRVHSPHSANRSIKLWHIGSATTHDAYLMDMFTSDTAPKHKVNINTGRLNVINALIGDQVVDGAALSSTAFLNNWIAYNGTTGGNPLLYRGDMYKFPDPATASDSEVEIAIGNIAELLDTRQNYFTVISAARSIEDVGFADVSNHRRSTSLGGGRSGIVRGTHRAISAIYHDAWGVDKPRILRTTVIEE